MKLINYKNSSFIIFITIAIWYAVGNFIWWVLNTPIIPQGICAVHFLDIFLDAVLYKNAPLITWIMKFMFFIFGKEYFDLQIIFMNYIFFLTALFFVYKIGLELKDKETGNIAMILFALTPAIYGMSRQYGHQDWHVMVAMIINIYCLIKLNDFKNRKWSILYGITVGLGLLIKDEFLPYFFVPWLYVVIRSLIETIETKKIINILLTIIFGSLIAGWHYFRFEIIDKILKDPFIESYGGIFDFDNIYMVTMGLSEYLLSPPIFVLFIISFIWFIYQYKNKNKYVILLWIIIPWFIIMFMLHHKLPEYMVGFVPAIILIISLYIKNIKKIFFKKILLILIILICLFQYNIFSYSMNFITFGIKYKDDYELYYFNLYSNSSFEAYDPNFMVYEKNPYIISLFEYLNNNFNNNSIFMFAYIYCTDLVFSYLKLNDFKNLEAEFQDIEKCDIIIDIEEFSIKSEFVFESLKEDGYSHNMETNIKEIKKYIDEKIMLIDNNYIQLDEFYLDRTRDHVYILGKKELFEGKENIIKYPYKPKE